MNHLGIDVGKRKCRAAIKDDKGKILEDFHVVRAFHSNKISLKVNEYFM